MCCVMYSCLDVGTHCCIFYIHNFRCQKRRVVTVKKQVSNVYCDDWSVL